MDEKEYIKLGNLTKISIARSIISDILPGHGYGVSAKERATISKAVYVIEERLLSEIHTEESADSGVVLERGKALVIRGAEGSGKSTLAHQIAAEHGSSADICLAQFRELILGRFGGVNEWLARPPASGRCKTLIIEEFAISAGSLEIIKPWISGSNVLMGMKGQDPTHIAPPQLILCVGSDQEIPDAATQRRYRIIDL